MNRIFGSVVKGFVLLLHAIITGFFSEGQAGL